MLLFWRKVIKNALKRIKIRQRNCIFGIGNNEKINKKIL